MTVRTHKTLLRITWRMKILKEQSLFNKPLIPQQGMIKARQKKGKVMKNKNQLSNKAQSVRAQR